MLLFFGGTKEKDKLAAAYSLRKLKKTYTGNAIRVRRSSDNAEQDIGFIDSNLDINALTTFLGADNGFITTWYDQSGNGNNATQATASYQPNIESFDRVVFDKTNDVLDATLTAISGTMILSTPNGTAAYEVNIPDGSYEIGGRGGNYMPDNAIIGQVIFGSSISDNEKTFFINNFKSHGGGDNYGAVTDFTSYWRDWSEITVFPLIDTSSGTSFNGTWRFCRSLTSFPLLDTSNGITFSLAWSDCSSFTSFPLLNTSNGTNFFGTWSGCTGLTSFPLLDTSSATDFSAAWQFCNSLTSFPLLDTSSGTNFSAAWQFCSSFTSFPLLDTSSGTNFSLAWRFCSGLTSFPLLDTSSGTSFSGAWQNCSGLTSFPANFFDLWTATPEDNCFVDTWDGCSSLTATSVENILNSIDTSGRSAPTSGVDITIDYNAASGTPNVSTAVANLKSRGWTITLNGVAQ